MLQIEDRLVLKSPPSRMKAWWHRLSRRPAAETSPSLHDRTAELEARCAELEERLRWNDDMLRRRTALLYDLQRQYATEHFNLHESVRDLKIERFRNAGAYTSRGVILNRARELQTRIRDLKQRLRAHESVEDLYFDDAPIFIEDAT